MIVTQVDDSLIRLAVHAGDRLMRETLSTALTIQPDLSLVGTASTAEDLRVLCAQHRPDVAVFDAATILSVLDAYGKVQSVSPQTDLVAITPDAPSADQLDDAPHGVTLLSYSNGLKDVLEAIRRRGRADGRKIPLSPRLTSRERTIVYLTGTGLNTPEIARALQLRPRTVENHKRHIYEKLGVNSQSHAVARAMSLGLLRAPDQTRTDGEPNRTTVVLMRGQADACGEEVMRSMVRARLPFMIVHDRRSLRDSWARRHHGPVTIVLVDPEPEDWTLSISMRAVTLVVRCTGTNDHSAVADALAHGAGGLIFRDDVASDFGLMLALVSQGHFVLSGIYAGALTRWQPPTAPVLTARESEILASIARGHSIRQTARTLGIAVKTVENTQARLFRKLGARNRTETLTIADGWGLVDHAVLPENVPMSPDLVPDGKPPARN